MCITLWLFASKIIGLLCDPVVPCWSYYCGAHIPQGPILRALLIAMDRDQRRLWCKQARSLSIFPSQLMHYCTSRAVSLIACYLISKQPIIYMVHHHSTIVSPQFFCTGLHSKLLSHWTPTTLSSPYPPRPVSAGLHRAKRNAHCKPRSAGKKGTEIEGGELVRGSIQQNRRLLCDQMNSRPDVRFLSPKRQVKGTTRVI